MVWRAEDKREKEEELHVSRDRPSITWNDPGNKAEQNQSYSMRQCACRSTGGGKEFCK